MEHLENLVEAIRAYNSKGAASSAQKAMDEGVNPVSALDAVSGVMKDIGDRFEAEELWLPDLIGAADAAQAALAVIETKIVESGQQPERLGIVVLGTVSGDIHNIGKTMVGALLTAHGFKVVDVGTNVTSTQFIQAVKDNNADILALSALLTTTAVEQAKVIESLKEEGLRDRVKVMVGGGAITPEFAEEIGADGYRATAPEAVGLAVELAGA
jgi:5-methyltetrahydrofolate--homocysteine methyltransferase